MKAIIEHHKLNPFDIDMLSMHVRAIGQVLRNEALVNKAVVTTIGVLEKQMKKQTKGEQDASGTN